MYQKAESIDISELPEVARLADEVARTGERRVLTRGDEVLAEIRPVKARRGRRGRAAKQEAATEEEYVPNDSLLNLIGIADGHLTPDAPTDVSANKLKYLAEGYFRIKGWPGSS